MTSDRAGIVFAPLCFRQAVAFSGQGYQAGAIEDRDPAPLGPDEVMAFEDLGRDRNARTAHAEHPGQKLVGERHLVGVGPIATHQEPTCEADLDRTDRIGESGLRHLVDEGLDPPHEDQPQGGTLLHGREEILRRNPQALPRHLNEVTVQTSIDAENYRRGRHQPLPADHADFDLTR